MEESLSKYWEKYYPGSNINLTGFENLSGLDIETGKQDIVIDYGGVSASPQFIIQDKQGLYKLFFEIGVNSFFVPFAQTELIDTHFKIPFTVWNKMQHGIYYGRVRNSLYQTIASWKWKKQ
jgi:hypothetical protein